MASKPRPHKTNLQNSNNSKKKKRNDKKQIVNELLIFVYWLGLRVQLSSAALRFVWFKQTKDGGKKKEELSKRGGTKKQYNFTAYANWQIA